MNTGSSRACTWVFQVWGFACLWTFLTAPAHAQPQVYEAGTHWQELSNPLPDLDPERYEVVELFWYGCPACYDLRPTAAIWESSYRSTDMNAFRMPLVENQVMETHARLYLTADALGLLAPAYSIRSDWKVSPGIHADLFAAIHEEHRPLRSADEAWSLFEAWGVSREAFDGAWNSEAVAAKLAELKTMPGLAEIPRLPALVLDGRYVITFNEAVTSAEDLYKVLNYLIYQTREETRRASR